MPGRTRALPEGLSEGRTYATALVLVLSLLAVNLTANLMLERWRRV
jgi:ABC-type phosphate transport system permease subunit